MAISVDDRPLGATAPTAPTAPAGSRAHGPLGRPRHAEARSHTPRHATALREAFWNLPNTITVLRVGVVPVLLLLPWWSGPFGSRVIAWCFIVAALTDIVDGWLARRGQQVTQIGKLLDPVADKLIVSTALIVLLAAGRIPAWGVWMIVVIVGRELAVTGLRGLASAGGQVMAASWQGKAKTLLQNIAIGALLFHYTTLGLPAQAIGLAFLAAATVLTLMSGYTYFAEYFRNADGGANAGRSDT